MKFVVRLTIIICFAVALLVFLLFSNTQHKQNGLELDSVTNHESYDYSSAGPHSHRPRDHNSFERRVAEYTEQYRLLWNLDVSEAGLWKIAADWISSRRIYREASSELGSILTAMTKSHITKADVGYRGTQLKLMLIVDGQQSVVFKPQWYDRNYVIEGLPYRGRDRHNGEIVAFHLSRMLGLHRVPLAVGRTVDLEKDILPVATERLRNTFFTNGTNTCFYGKCLYCKNQASGVCANGTKLEGTVILMLPKRYQFEQFRHPWSRTYKPDKKAR